MNVDKHIKRVKEAARKKAESCYQKTFEDKANIIVLGMELFFDFLLGGAIDDYNTKTHRERLIERDVRRAVLEECKTLVKNGEPINEEKFLEVYQKNARSEFIAEHSKHTIPATAGLFSGGVAGGALAIGLSFSLVASPIIVAGAAFLVFMVVSLITYNAVGDGVSVSPKQINQHQEWSKVKGRECFAQLLQSYAEEKKGHSSMQPTVEKSPASAHFVNRYNVSCQASSAGFSK